MRGYLVHDIKFILITRSFLYFVQDKEYGEFLPVNKYSNILLEPKNYKW
jgi:hypothetical protein